MQLAYGLEQFVPPPTGIVLTIGNFDGVHRGHAALLDVARETAARLGARVTVMTFHGHPLTVLAPERAPAQLTTLPEKLALLEKLGATHCIVLRADPALFARQADDFLASLVAHCRPRALVEGPDFKFGRGRTGTIATLTAHAAEWGYEVHVVPTVHCPELPTHPIINSTSIRQALRDGRVEQANTMLGRPYRVVGTAGHGHGRGHALGFPTANLAGIAHLLPQEAVYGAVAQLEDGALYLAAVNVGPQPTFAQDELCVEAHVLDFDGDVRGRRVGLHFLARLREQTKFASAAELTAQIRRDVAATRALAPGLTEVRRLQPPAL